MRLLLAEDDLMVGESIRDGLRKHGFAVDWVTSGMAAESALSTHSHDLLLRLFASLDESVNLLRELDLWLLFPT